MKTAIIGITTLLSLAIAAPIQAQYIVNIYSGFNNEIIGTVVDDPTDDLSICNKNGKGGSYLEPKSIFSYQGMNGSNSSVYGAYNQFGARPPYIMYGRTRVVVTANNYFIPSIHPDKLRADNCTKR